MSLVQFLIILSTGTVLSAGTWILVLMTLDPFSSGPIAPLLFYVSAWLMIVGGLTLVGFFVRFWLERDHVPFEQVAVAWRQATLLGTGLVSTLILQHAKLLNGWTFSFLLLVVAATEFFFIAGRASRPRRTGSVTS